MIWMELHCSRLREGCPTTKNTYPMGGSPDTKKSLLRLHTNLCQEAKADGWKYYRGEGWVCRHCIATKPEAGE